VLLVATGALAAPAPPPPTITGQPANPTNQSSATFTFTDAKSGATFNCKLDSGAFAACTTPRTYTGLAVGSHTFQVQAFADGKTSGATSYTWSIDGGGPTVTSINRTDASPSKGNPLRFTVTFNEAVTGVGIGNFGLVTAGLGGAAPTIASVTPASGSAKSFTVNVGTAGTTGGNSGSSIGLNLIAKSPIRDGAGNALGGSVPVVGQVYAFDTTAPVVALTKVNGAVVSFPFVSSAKVTSIGGTCGTASGDLAQVAWSIGGQSGTASCSAGAWSSASLKINGNGSYTATASQSDQAGNSGSSGPKAVTVDRTAPTVSSINRTDANPTNAGPLHWTVTFSEPVSNVGAGSFGLVRSGISGSAPVIASAIAVGAAPAAAWTVTVATTGTTGTNSGSIGLNLTANGTIQDGAGNLLGGPVPVVGQAYAYDTTAPVMPTITAGPPLLPSWTTTTNASFSFTGDAGATFLCSLNSSAAGDFTACTSAKSYSGVAQGPNTFYVKSRDAAGNLSAFVSRQWRVDTVAPPAPVLMLVPPNPDSGSRSNFDWTPQPPSGDVDHYECSTESGAFSTQVPSFGEAPVSCRPPLSYVVATTSDDQHRFAVRAVDAAGNASGAVSHSWKVAGSIQDFTITGSAVGLLYPGGPARPITVTLHNPNNLPIYVTALTVAATASTPAGCDHDDLVVVQADLTAATPNPYPGTIVVPANGSVTLPDQSVAAPTIQLQNRDFDQTPTCAGQTFSLTYTGSAHS
jgi:hypothetical protein